MKARTVKIGLLMALGAVVSTGIFAQPANFQQHGNNSSGTPTAQEATDSITVGGQIRYVVAPDTDANPAYDFATMSGTLVSQFNWTVDAAVGTITPATDDDDNDITVSANTTAGTGNIQVQEQLGACAGATVTIPIAVIDEPTADFASATATICQSDTVGGYDIDITLATATDGGRITYAIQFDGPSTSDLYSTTATTVDEGTITITIPEGNFGDGVGDYVISFTEISDHISTKSNIPGTSTTGTHTLTINRTPNTGVIYHLPNM